MAAVQQDQRVLGVAGAQQRRQVHGAHHTLLEPKHGRCARAGRAAVACEKKPKELRLVQQRQRRQQVQQRASMCHVVKHQRVQPLRPVKHGRICQQLPHGRAILGNGRVDRCCRLKTKEEEEEEKKMMMMEKEREKTKKSEHYQVKDREIQNNTRNEE